MAQHPSFTATAGRLYAWGCGESDHAIPNAKSLRDGQKHIPFPLEVNLSGQNRSSLLFHQVCADTGGVFAALDNRGRAIVWGNSQRHGFPESALIGYQLARKREQTFQLLAVGDNFVIGISKREEDDVTPITKGGKLMEWRSVGKSKGGSGGFVDVPELEGKNIIDVAACGNVALVIVREVKDSETIQKSLYMRVNGSSSQSSTYADYLNEFTIVKELATKNICLISVGSTTRACVDDENTLFTWGANRNGALGLGRRTKSEVKTPMKVRLPPTFETSKIVSLDCTRGQPNPKNNLPNPTGQEGPRIHLVTDDGHLWIAGTCHKGLGADHIGKIMTSSGDHLTFYKVGGLARDANTFDKLCFTGALDMVPMIEAKEFFSTGKTLGLSEKTKQALIDSGAISSDGTTVSDDEKSSSGTMTKYLSEVSIKASVASHIHSFAMTTSGELFGFGCGSNGRLGVPYFFKKDGSKRLMKCYVSTPSRVGQLSEDSSKETPKSFRNERVLAVSLGRYWSFGIVE